MRLIAALGGMAAVCCALVVLVLGNAFGCYDDDLTAHGHPARSTLMVSKPGVTSPQPTVDTQSPAP